MTTDQGWKRTLYVVFLVEFIVATGFSFIAPFLPLYVKFLGSRWHLSVEFLSGLVFSSAALTMMFASPVWGALADRYGRKLMVIRATFGGAVLLFLMGFARSAEELVLLRALQGAITGVLSANSALLAAAVPRDRAGYALGMLQVALNAGFALGPLVGGMLADAFGYRFPFLITAASLALAGLLVVFGVEDKTPRGTREGRRSLLAEWRTVVKRPGVSLVYGLRFLSHLGQSISRPFLPLLVAALASSGEAVATWTGIVASSRALMTSLNATWLGRLGDRVGHRRLAQGAAVVLGLAYLLHAFAPSVPALIVAQGLVGVGLGGFTPALAALLARYTRPGEEGAAYGIDNSMMAAARTVAPLVGASIAMWLGLRWVFVLSGFVYLGVVSALVRALPQE